MSAVATTRARRSAPSGTLATALGLLSGLALAGASGCGSSGGTTVDAGADFAIGPQVTHVGPSATTCCMVANGAGQVLYLVNPAPSKPDAQGRDQPANGELHLSDPFGADISLGQGVPAGGYAFSPDQKWALFLTKTKTFRYALNIVPLEGPELHQPSPNDSGAVVVPDGLQNAALSAQSFFTPSGRFLVVGVLPRGVAVSPDLHVIDINGRRDVFQLTNGAFDYQEQVTLDDTMIYANSTASTMPGVPSVEGLYLINLAAAPQVPPALIDTHVTNFSTTADGARLVYTRANGDLFLFGLQQNDFLPLGSGVISFTLGPSRRGPLVYTTRDQALHVRTLLKPESVTTVAGSIDLFSPVQFSPDAQHLYYFKAVESQNNVGDLYHVPLPPLPAAAPSLVASRASTRDFHFVGDRLITVSNVDGTGATGDVTVSALDGSGASVVARGAATGEVVTAFPAPPPPTANGQINYGPADLAPLVLAPVFAHLTGASADVVNRPIDGSRAIVGNLAFAGPELLAGGAEQPLAMGVKSGGFTVSDDSYALVYIANASWSRVANNYVGQLGLQQPQTLVDIAPVKPVLDGVSELGTIVNRSLFVAAPGANPPGIYFIHY